MSKNKKIGWCVFKSERNYFPCLECPKPCNKKPSFWWQIKEWLLCRIYKIVQRL